MEKTLFLFDFGIYYVNNCLGNILSFIWASSSGYVVYHCQCPKLSIDTQK